MSEERADEPLVTADELRALRDEVRELTARVRALEARASPARAPRTAPAASRAAAPESRPPVAAAAAAGAHGPQRAHVERVLTTNWLAVAGAFVLVMGVGFFLRYAFEHDWIGLGARIALGVVGGFALVVTGDVLARRGGFGAWPQVVSASGAAITYFSVFAAYQFEPYRAATGVTAPVASVLLAFAALAFAAFAAWRDAPALAGVGVVLATATAFLADVWTGLGVTYALVLGLAVAAAAAWRAWPLVTLAAIAGSFLVVFVNVVDAGAWAPGAFAAAVVAFAGFTGLGLALGTRVPRAREGALPLMAAFTGLAAWGVSLLAVVNPPGGPRALAHAYPGVDGGVTLAFAGVLVAVALGARRVHAGYAKGAAGAGVLALLAWPPLAFEGVVVPFAWGALVAVATGLMATARGTRGFARAAAVAAGALAAVVLIVNVPAWFPPDAPVLTFLAYATVAVALAVAWRVDAITVDAESARVHPLFLFGSVAVVTTYLGNALEGYWVSGAWAFEGLVLMALGFVLSLKELRTVALGAFALTLFRLFVIDLATLDLGYRIIAFLVVGALLLVASGIYARAQRDSDA